MHWHGIQVAFCSNGNLIYSVLGYGGVKVSNGGGRKTDILKLTKYLILTGYAPKVYFLGIEEEKGNCKPRTPLTPFDYFSFSLF